jgi:thiamine pyrophosphate-dependent acetolactate synthase large subunit-like protein
MMESTASVLLTGGEAVVRSLERHGVTTVFGIPGEHNIPIYRALSQSDIRHVAPRHEQGAGFMADGYARVTGRPGVCIVVTGPGLTNAATAMAQAYTDSVPLLVLSGQIRGDWLDKGGGHFHELKDQLGFSGALLDWSERVESVAAIPDAMDRALGALRNGARGVHLEFLQDVLYGSVEVSFNEIEASSWPAPEATEVERAAQLLVQAQRPAIVVGGGARQSGESLVALAERIGAPLLTTWRATGAVPATHRLAAGSGLELQAARVFLQERDAVLIIGSELSQIDFFPDVPPLKGAIQIDRDPVRLGAATPIDVGITGDAGETLQALLTALGPGPTEQARAAEETATLRAQLDAEATSHGERYRAVVSALRTALPAETVLAADLTGPTYWAVPRFFPFEQPDQLLFSGIGTLGYALPGAIGAKTAFPDRPVVVIAGDGGFMFTAAELVTAAELEQNLVVLVWNNRGFGDIRRQLVESGARPVGVDLKSPDFVQLAEACGGVGFQLDDARSLPALVHDALGRRCPTLIEVVAND